MEKSSSIQVTFTTGHRNLPYATDEENGHHPMIWLSREPERITEIPELQNEPELKAFISAINAPGRHFETFRCAHSDTEAPGSYTRAMYVAVLFRDRALAASIDNYMILAREIVTGTANHPDFPANTVPFELRLAQHWLKEESAWVYTADIQFWIQALDQAAMRNEMSKEMAFLEKILTS